MKEVNSYGRVASYFRCLVNPSSMTGFLSGILLLWGFLAPMIDFSFFNENIDIQYGLGKICKNIGIISPMWSAIPYGVAIAIVLMFVLSFVNIPILKIIPSLLLIVMFSLIIFDIGNVVDLIKSVLAKYIEIEEKPVDVVKTLGCMMYGVYLTLAGLLAGIVGCFLPGKK